MVWLFAEHHNGFLDHEFELLLISLAAAVFNSCFLAAIYLALEPIVRRRWPHRIISWSRLLAGDFRDPLVGRDILVGAAFGTGMIVCASLASAAMRWIGQPGQLNVNPGNTFIGSHIFVNKFATQLTATLFIGFIPLFLLLLFVLILKREWLALIMLWLLLTLVQSLLAQVRLPMLPLIALLALLAVIVLNRFGLLAMISAMFFLHLWVFFPMTTELTAWYATDFTIALVIALATGGVWFLRVAGWPTAGQRQFLDRDQV